VISRNERTAVLEFGTKVDGYGKTCRCRGCAAVRAVHEEHFLLDVQDDMDLRVGEAVELVTGYCPGTMNLNDACHVV
jgi:hypothetical protein